MPGEHVQNLQMQSLRTGFPGERKPALNIRSGGSEAIHSQKALSR